jgi:hypothetical protein
MLPKLGEKSWLQHPDPEVDLAIMPIGARINEWRDLGIEPLPTFIDTSAIPSDTQWKKLVPLDELCIIGYPTGLSDKVNHLPIFRKGVAATHPNIDFDGKNEFLIDLGIYPGSSGSPVFLADNEFYRKSRTVYSGRDHAKLLGIVYSLYPYNFEGSIQPDVYRKKEHVQTPIPIGIGTVIKSTRLKDFEPLLRQLLLDYGIAVVDFLVFSYRL